MPAPNETWGLGWRVMSNAVGILESGRVAIGGRDHPADPIAAWIWRPCSSTSAGRDALRGLDRRVEPQTLLGRDARVAVGVVHEARPLLRVAQQRQDTIADQVHCRLMAGEEQQRGIDEDLLRSNTPR